MKKIYESPVTCIKTIDEQLFMLADSDESKAGFFESADGYEQTDVTDGSSVTSSQVLAKPLLWDDGEAE